MTVNFNIVVLSVIAFIDIFLAVLLFVQSSKKLANTFFALIALSSGLWVAVGVIRYFAYSLTIPFLPESLIYTKLSVIFSASIFFFFTLFASSFSYDKIKIPKWVLYSIFIFYFVDIFSIIIPNFIIISESFDINIIQPAYNWGIGYTNFHSPLLVVCFIAGLVSLLNQYKVISNKNIKKQLRYVLFGTGMAGGFGIIFGLLATFFPLFSDLFWIGRLSTLIFIGFVSYAILKFQLFDIKVAATELFIFSIWIFILIRSFLSTSPEDEIANIALLILTIIVGVLLIRSVIKEVKQREKIELLNKDLEEANRKQEGLMRRSMKHLDKIISTKELDAQHAFTLKTGLGIPEDFLEDFCVRHNIIFPRVEFLRLIEEHRIISRQPKK